mgnify:CR=1 FL=1
MSEIILDSVIDSIKLLPFLFLTYLFMEWLEHKTGAAARKRIRTAGKFGPVWGGLLGVIPQCGFSAAASSLFAGRVITVGTLIAVYLSTSDEMFPIMISNAVPVVTIVKILTCKAVIGILSGLVLEYVYTHILKKQEPDVDIHEICEEERCHCEHGVISSAAFHTLKVFVYIFLISLALNIIIGLVGEEIQTKKHWKFAKEIVYIQKQSSKLYHSRRLFFYVITFSHPQKSARSSFR